MPSRYFTSILSMEMRWTIVLGSCWGFCGGGSQVSPSLLTAPPAEETVDNASSTAGKYIAPFTPTNYIVFVLLFTTEKDAETAKPIQR